MRTIFNLVSTTTALSVLISFSAAAEEINTHELLNMSLEELSNIEVTSVSKKAEKANQAAAAVYVITQDDIRRSGATAIPEVLRMAPGINVARTGAYQWAVSSRGFNDQFANKLLVLIDGRSVYSPLFGGVFWDVQDTLIEDIERIEVIRGPGGTIWGANAVNGVINIITKNAKDTQGGLATLTHGNQERGIAGGRFGAKLDEGVYGRAYAKVNSRGDEYIGSRVGAHDELNKGQGGFRIDFEPKNDISGKIQGDIYTNNEDLNFYMPSFVTPPVSFAHDNPQASGANILAKINYKQSENSEFSLQAYFDNTRRRALPFGYTTNTFDTELQQVVRTHAWNEITWGLGYRLVDDRQVESPHYAVDKIERSDSIYSAFIQDKFSVIPESLFITVGSKFEHNEYTGAEIQPSARFSWLVNDKQTVWGAVSRAVRTPNRFTDNVALVLAANPAPLPPGFASTAPNKGLDSEDVIAYELGYRVQPAHNVSLDSTVFYNDYDNIFNSAVSAPFLQLGRPFSPYFELPIATINGNSGRSYGFEMSANWDVTKRWSLSGNYSYIDLKFDQPSGVGFTYAGKEPQQQFNIRSNLLFSDNWELNNALYYTDNLSGISVPNYWRFDTRLGWRVAEGIELSVVGQNLLDKRHPEFSNFLYQNQIEIGRSVYGNVAFRF